MIAFTAYFCNNVFLFSFVFIWYYFALLWVVVGMLYLSLRSAYFVRCGFLSLFLCLN